MRLAEMCKNLAAEPGLPESMKWETHKIASGMMAVAMVPADHQAAFQRAGEKMQAVAAKLESGGQAVLCGVCTSYGKLARAGAMMEEIHSAAGHIGLVTSNDRQVVEMIHAHAQRTMDEYEKWLAEQAQHGTREGSGPGAVAARRAAQRRPAAGPIAAAGDAL